MTDRAEDRERLSAPIDMVLHCPACGAQHIDAPESPGEYTLRGYDPLGAVALAWTNPPHRSHLCHGCGHIWRPADVPTNGVAAVKTRGKNDPPAVSLAAPAVSLAAEVERLKACLFQMQEAAKDLARQLDAERRKVDALREALRNLLMFECDDQMPRHEADCHEFAGSTVKRDLLVAAMDALAATKGEK